MIEVGLLYIILAIRFKPNLSGLSYDWLDDFLRRQEEPVGAKSMDRSDIGYSGPDRVLIYPPRLRDQLSGTFLCSVSGEPI